MTEPARTVHVIEATHWDREWRFPFEATRIRLIRLMDNLLEILEKDTAGRRRYHLDGQAIPIEDYLEMRPENARRLKAVCKAGKLLVGPWYTLPEENLVLGESLVRNFLVGRAASREFGGAMPVGYSPTSYGQVSQMPQIMAGFGVTSILFYRGVNRQAAPQSEFWWQSPDGSKILAFRFCGYGRANFFHLVYRPLVHGRDRSKQEHLWADGGAPFRLAGSSSIAPYELIEPPMGWHPEEIDKAIANLDADIRDNTTPHLLGMQTQDSLEAYPELAKLVDALNARAGREAYRISSLPDYIAAVLAAGPQLQTLTGEMRHTQKEQSITDLYPHIFPARAYIKTANRAAELELSRWAEPAAALGWLLGDTYPAPFLTRAWKLLLANHAHDSISGCSMDTVHEDTMDRNRQVRIIAGELAVKGLGRIAASIDGAKLAKDDVLLVVFNPELRERSEVVPAELETHVDDQFDSFEIVDEAGRPAPVQLAGGEDAKLAIFQSPLELPLRMRARNRKLYFRAENVPALGYKSYLLRRGGKGSIQSGSLLAGPRGLANEHLKVEVAVNGTFSLTNRETGRTFSGLGLFEDDGEVGDPWVRYAPKEDRLVTSSGAKAAVAVVEDGPLSATLSVRFDLRVPACALGFDQKRSPDEVVLAVENLLTLRAGARRLEVVTRFVNTAKDHRLRIALPTGLVGATKSAAESAFDVVERPVAVPDGTGWREPPSGCQPHLGFVDVSDGTEGLALLDMGVPQYEVREDAARTLVLTLMRCFAQKNTVRRAEYPDQPGSQCLGPQEFRWALMPHRGDWQAGGVMAEAYAYLLPLRAAQAGRSTKGTLPRSASFFALRPAALELAAVKRAEDRDRVILRLWNPSDRETTAELVCLRKPKVARELTLAEEPLGRLKVRKNAVQLRAGARKILTVEIGF
ncbi:MAG TPA: glycosyl hydrolase-related protein [Planctomycetota bacterium]|nr:glycosyl hydrolase-related protein [Planctomycetota bacterium]